jgi:hypothetical protein
MRVSTEVLALTEKQINKAFEERNIHMLEKETIFILNNLAFNLAERYSDILHLIKPMRVRIRKEPEFIFKEDYLSSLKRMLLLSERIFREPVDFSELKLSFESWFYEITSDGTLVFQYKPDHLLSITEAAEQLGVSRAMMYKYIDRGLETVGEKGSQKIPKHILEAWKNPALAFQMQWIYQVKKTRTQSVEEKLEFINKQIAEYEKEYRGTFYQLFGGLDDHEIDGMSEAVDIADWKELEKEKQRLLSQLNG